MIKYSVIIPVYNAQSTLERCLDSLVNQNRSDVELLVINDGSQDSSSEICRRYAERFPCVNLYEKINGGVSSARNLGLDHARGDYILFVDSDDYVDDDYFSALDSILSDNRVELAMFGSRFFGKGDRSPKIGSGVWQGDKATDIICSWARTNLFFSLWSKVFRRDVIEKHRIRFDEDLSISEDVVFIFAYAIHVDHVVCSDRILYYVSEENDHSLSRKPIQSLADKLTQALELMRTTLANAKLPEVKNRKYVDILVFLNYRSAYSVAKQTKNINNSADRRSAIRQICCRFSEYPDKPYGMESLLASIPIKLKMTRLIDVLIQRKR